MTPGLTPPQVREAICDSALLLRYLRNRDHQIVDRTLKDVVLLKRRLQDAYTVAHVCKREGANEALVLDARERTQEAVDKWRF